MQGLCSQRLVDDPGWGGWGGYGDALTPFRSPGGSGCQDASLPRFPQGITFEPKNAHELSQNGYDIWMHVYMYIYVCVWFMCMVYFMVVLVSVFAFILSLVGCLAARC